MNVCVCSQVSLTLETVASQDWVREKCGRNRNQLLDSDMLGDHSLSSNSQAKYLLHLLTPYCSASPADLAQLAKMDSNTAVVHILKVPQYAHTLYVLITMILSTLLCGGLGLKKSSGRWWWGGGGGGT